MHNMKQYFFLLLWYSNVKATTVCSEDELVWELRDDLRDNGFKYNKGKLDCLRSIAAPSKETSENRDMRLRAQWDSDCSFEAEDMQGQPSWWKTFSDVFKINFMVDVNGKQVTLGGKDLADQADMCEIIRTLLSNGYFPDADITIQKLDFDFLWDIFCPGDDGQTKVCAFSTGSYSDKQKWHVLLGPAIIKFGGQPLLEIQKDLKN